MNKKGFSGKNPVVIGNLRISVLSAGLIRLEYAADGVFIDNPSLAVQCRDTSFGEFELKQTARSWELITPLVKLVYYPDYGMPRNGVLDFFIDGKYHSFGEENHGNLGGSLDSLDGVRSRCSLSDGVISTDGWYILHDTTPLRQSDGTLRARPDSADAIDCYLFVYKSDYKLALQMLGKLTGFPALPPRKMFGAWYSRWQAYTSEDFRRIAAMYKRFRLPLDVLVLDMDWHRIQDAVSGYGWGGTLGWTGWSWNRELLPDAEKLLEDLHKDNLLVALNIHPHDGIREHEDCREDFQRFYPGHDGRFSIGDPEYMRAYFDCANKPLRDVGCDIFWLDWQQDMLFPEVPENGGKVLLQLNYAYAEFDRSCQCRPMLISRWGGWGDQRSGMKFSGDVAASWETLAFEILYTILSGNVCNDFISHDLGGFSGERNAELFVRWLQFGALSCAMRIHSSCSVPERLPWDYPEPFRSAIFSAYRLHERLLDEIYSAAIECSKSALPVVRGMYLEHPGESAAMQLPYQYYLGNNILAFPVTDSAAKSSESMTTVRIFDGEWFDPWQQCSFLFGEYLLEKKLDEPGLLLRCGIPFYLTRHGKGKDVFIALPDNDGVYINRVKICDGWHTGDEITVQELKLSRCGRSFSLELPPLPEGGNLILGRCKVIDIKARVHCYGNYVFKHIAPSLEPQNVTFEADLAEDRSRGSSGCMICNRSIRPAHPVWDLTVATGEASSCVITCQHPDFSRSIMQCNGYSGKLLHLPLPDSGEKISVQCDDRMFIVKHVRTAILIFEKNSEKISLKQCFNLRS